jgi:hypothetical protein
LHGAASRFTRGTQDEFTNKQEISMTRKTWITLLGGAAATLALFAPAAHADSASIHFQIGTPGYGGSYYGNGYGSGYYGGGYYPGYVAQPGYVYPAPRYVAPRHRGYHRSDRDRDGIPNRYDRDRDGDGVPNRWDRRPNNHWRR